MPTYDYVCHHCGHRFEVIHGVHADGPATCPVCHKGPVRKAFSAPSIVFKGSGWAKKDRSATSKPASGTGSSTGSEAGSGSGTGSGSGDKGTTAPDSTKAATDAKPSTGTSGAAAD